MFVSCKMSHNRQAIQYHTILMAKYNTQRIVLHRLPAKLRQTREHLPDTGRPDAQALTGFVYIVLLAGCNKGDWWAVIANPGSVSGQTAVISIYSGSGWTRVRFELSLCFDLCLRLETAVIGSLNFRIPAIVTMT